jgi:hypothetical protein
MIHSLSCGRIIRHTDGSCLYSNSVDLVINVCLHLAETIPTLWPTVNAFVKKHPTYIAEDNAQHFMVDDPTKGLDGKYNLCHVPPSSVSSHASSGRILRSPIYGSSDQKYTQITSTTSIKQAVSSMRDGAMHLFTVSQQHSFSQNHKSISFMILDIVIPLTFDVPRTRNPT